MKIYKYWVVEKAKVLIDGEETEITCYGGSNASEQDASAKAREKAGLIEKRIAGERHVFDSYEVEIREEVVQVLDEKAAITRNRYGAQVLNVEDMMIMDIDRPRFSFWDLFRKPKDGKTRIIEMVRTLSQKPGYSGLGFRIYETHSGIRVIVLGQTFDAKATETRRMMKEFHCDRLYALMCRKQDCFRARLTPKPYRMKLKGYKVRVPRTSDEENEFRQWLAGYESASRKIRVCRFMEQIGVGSVNDKVRLHDEMVGISREQRLA
jgi:hypothetical protein